MPLFLKIDCHDDMLESGLILKEVIDFCKDAKEYGVDVLNISRGNIITAATLYEVAPVDIKNGFNVEDAHVFVKKQKCLQCLVDISILLNLRKRY